MNSPYENLPAKAYWRSGVASRNPASTEDFYAPNIGLNRRTKIATAGSCFAQHVGRTLKKAGFNIMDEEPGPNVPDAVLNQHGYNMYSARYGNIYTTRQLAQLLEEAFDGLKPANPIWEKDGRYYDAFRPSVEPNGLATPEDVQAHRADHLAAVRRLFSNLEVFVFTFGLTEAWVSKEDGTVYPTAPGTIAGTFDPEKYEFRNFRYNEILKDFLAVRRRIRQFNPKARFIVTVSPVPLTATASGHHVEVASSYSKSVLRAVCGALSDDFKAIEYFPSYEVITSQVARGTNYAPNMRSVTPEGVQRAMDLFMNVHDKKKKKTQTSPVNASQTTKTDTSNDVEDDVVCEDALLDAFAK